MNARSVTLATRVTEIESPLPGSRAWVAKVIEEGEIRIGSSRDGSPVAWLCLPPVKSGEKSRYQLLASRHAVYECGHQTIRTEAWPTQGDLIDDWADGGPSWFSVALTKAGYQLARQFARKARTLLRLALRRDDAKLPGRFRVKLTAA